MMEYIITNGIYDYTIFVISGKYHKAIWTSNYVVMANHILTTNLHVSWVHSKSVQNSLFHRFVLFKHECCTLFKHGSHVHDFHV